MLLLRLIIGLLFVIEYTAGSSLSLFPPPVEPIVLDSGTRPVEITCSLHHSASNNGQFRWSKDGQALEPSSGRTIQNSDAASVLTINDVRESDEGDYVCTHTAVLGESVGISVRVNADAHYINESSDMIRIQNFTVGENAIVHCPSYLGDPPGEMRWRRGDVFIHNDPLYTATSDMITIPDIQLSDSGQYYCQIYRQIQGLLPLRPITVNVFENTPKTPMIDKSGPHHIQSWYEQPLNLTCDIISGDEPITITWYVTGTTSQSFPPRGTSHLYLEPSSYSSGHYQCRASNSHGSDTFSIYVEVQAPPRPPNVDLATVTAKEGSVITLAYHTLLPPIDTASLEYTWMKQHGQSDEKFIPVPLDNGKFVKNRIRGLLTINNITLSDAGKYRVNISNMNGSSIQTMQLNVESLKPMTTEPRHLATMEPVVQGHWFQFDISSSSSCMELQDMTEELSAALRSGLCAGNNDRCNDVSVNRITCSTETTGQFSASVSQLPPQETFNLVVNGVSVQVTSCGTAQCSEPTKPSPSYSGTISGVIVAMVIIIITVGVVIVGTVIVRQCRKTRRKASNDIESQASTCTNSAVTNDVVETSAEVKVQNTKRPPPPTKLCLKQLPSSTNGPRTMTPGRSTMTPSMDKYEQLSPAMCIEGSAASEKQKLSPKPRFQRSLSYDPKYYGSYSHRLTRNT